jgi:hypothetical protein
MGPRKSGTLPAIPWAKEKGALIWKMLAEVEKPEFRLVILGKKDTAEVCELSSIYLHCFYS